MTNYVSFSLWGNQPIYNVGAIRNAELMKTIYPDWKMIVFYDFTVPSETIQKLIDLDVVVRDMTNSGFYGMFWRFFAHDEPDCEYVVFRDTDSRISEREKFAVDEWIYSGKSIHIMRDHPAHGIPYGNNRLGILGGMWGIKTRVIPITELIRRYPKAKENSYGNDQAWLKSIYSIFENDRCTHDEFFENKLFPIKRVGQRFIGERINIDENPLTQDYLSIPL
jgi:hypothetical protein